MAAARDAARGRQAAAVFVAASGLQLFADAWQSPGARRGDHVGAADGSRTGMHLVLQQW